MKQKLWTGGFRHNEHNELLKGAKLLKEDKVIYSFLLKMVSEIDSAFVLGHIPSQGEDLYSILINGKIIVSFVHSYINGGFTEIEKQTVNEYIENLSKDLHHAKQNRAYLAAALDLAGATYF